MKIRFPIAFIVAAVLSGAGAAYAATITAPAGATVAINGATASAAGRPLYVYDRDSRETSTCVGPCTASWPPLMADAGAQAAGDWTLFDRPDGGRQWAYKGKPVYGFFRDAPGAPAGGDNKVPGWRLLK